MGRYALVIKGFRIQLLHAFYGSLEPLLIGTARKTSREFESQGEMVFPKNHGDPGHSGLSVGLS